jgi:CheY-like chemotaxis protein
MAPPPDVAVISLVMPTTSGAEVARAVQQKWQIPVILLSTVPPASVPEDMKGATHVRCVAVPCLPEDLVKHIDGITIRR